MDIEIVSEPLDQMLGGLQLDRERHEVLPDPDWIRWAHRLLGRDDLLVYWNKETDTCVFAQWLNRDAGWVQEIETLDEGPDRGGWLDASHLRMRCRTQHELNLEIARRIHRRREAEKRAKTEDRAQKQETIDWLNRKGMTAEAQVLRQAPFAGKVRGGEQLEQLTESLLEGTRGKVVTGYGTTGDRRS